MLHKEKLKSGTKLPKSTVPLNVITWNLTFGLGRRKRGTGDVSPSSQEISGGRPPTEIGIVQQMFS